MLHDCSKNDEHEDGLQPRGQKVLIVLLLLGKRITEECQPSLRYVQVSRRLDEP